MSGKLFGHTPTIKGAIVGNDGSRVWVIWTRAYYGPLGDVSSGNTFYILRLVVENESLVEDNAKALGAILEMAQNEAAE